MGTLLAILMILQIAGASVASIHVLLFYKRPTTAVAWLFAIWVLPFAGALAYATLSVYEGPRSLRRRRRSGTKVRIKTKNAEDNADYSKSVDDPNVRTLAAARCPFPMTRGNEITVVPDRGESLRAMLDTIRSAQNEVLLQTYDLSPGRVLNDLREALSDRVRAGVDVRVLIDPIGSARLPSSSLRSLRAEGITVESFLRPNPMKGRFQINFRNHRKQLIIDGSTGYVGGRNWADPYFLEPKEKRTIRDLTVRVQGPVVASMRRVFAEDWCIATDESIDEVFGDPALLAEATVGNTQARVLTCGPDDPNAAFVDLMTVVFMRAKESILIVTPYFVPGPSILDMLRIASLSGVDVTILAPQESDSRIADYAARYWYRQLVDAGIRVLLRPGPFLHTKALVVDGVWATLGSTNFDIRSFGLNYELNLEVLGETFARDLIEYLADDVEKSHEFTGGKAKIKDRLFEGTAALFEPIL